MTCKFVVKYHFCAMAHINIFLLPCNKHKKSDRSDRGECFMSDVVFDNNISQDIFMGLSHNGSRWVAFVGVLMREMHNEIYRQYIRKYSYVSAYLCTINLLLYEAFPVNL